MGTPAVITAAVLVAANVVLILVLLSRRWLVLRRQHRHDRLVQELRRSAILLVESDESELPPALAGADKAVFAELLAGYSRQLSGPSKDRIVAYFEATGAVDDELAALRSRRSWRRAAAAFTLGDFGSTRAVGALIATLDDPAREVRMAATRSLGRIGSVEAIDSLVTAGVEGRVPADVANLALLDIGPAALPYLHVLATHSEPAVRTSAVQMIGLLGSAGDAPAVREQLTDAAAPVRIAAASALGRLGAGAARDALMRALEDRVPAVREAAATALGQLGGRQATAALLPIAQGDSFDVARAAAAALSRIDPRVVMRAAGEPDAGPHLHEAADRLAL
jgi:HEAT repeat protein